MAGAGSYIGGGNLDYFLNELEALFAAKTHGHELSAITGLQAVLDGKLGKAEKAVSASSADKWTNERTITVSGDVSGAVSIDGSANKTLTLTHKTSGVTAGSYGPAAAATLAFGGSVNVPQVTVDGKGHVTKAVHYAIKLPAAPTTISGNAGTATKLQTKRTIILSGAVSGSASFDGSENITITTTTASNERRLPAGSFLWFAGPRTKKPTYSLICDGSAVSRTTYADLFAAIGTTYGAGNGSSTFNLPNLLDGGDNSDKGRFIRAAKSDSQLGEKQEDTQRNITGKCGGVLAFTVNGPFDTESKSSYLGNGGELCLQANFDVSRVIPTSNENRPTCIAFTPVIFY